MISAASQHIITDIQQNGNTARTVVSMQLLDVSCSTDMENTRVAGVSAPVAANQLQVSFAHCDPQPQAPAV